MSYSCARTSHDLNESFLGTASPFRYALMIEYPEEFPESAIIGSSFSDELKKHILSLYEVKSNTRILLMKQGNEHSKKKRLFWADCSRETNQLWQYEFDDYQDLLSLKLGEIDTAWTVVNEPQFFICTNGQHDPCCGQYGAALFESVSPDHENVWQTTHLGGDRFAANVLALPAGIYYRRVHTEALKHIIAHHQQDKLYLPHFAGRAIYDRPVQIAEYFIREKTHISDLHRFTFRDFTSNGGVDVVKFQDGELVYVLKLQRVEEDTQLLYSCHAKTPGPLVHFELLEYVTSKV